MAFYPRCHPDFMGMTPCTWRDANTSPATDVCPTLQNTVRRKFSAVPCTLSGPFRENITQSHTFLDELFPLLSCAGSLYRHGSPLSPLQRFSVLNLAILNHGFFVCQYLFANFSKSAYVHSGFSASGGCSCWKTSPLLPACGGCATHCSSQRQCRISRPQCA